MIEAVANLQTIGETKTYIIKKNETKVFEEGELPKRCVVHLLEVRAEGEEIIFEKPRPFVPTFQIDKSENESILAWSNKEETENPTIKVKGHLIKDLGTLAFHGEGYTEVIVNITESFSIEELGNTIANENPPASDKAILLSELVNQWFDFSEIYFKEVGVDSDKVKDIAKETFTRIAKEKYPELK